MTLATADRYAGWVLLGPTLDVAYLCLVITVAHTKAREGLVGRPRAARVPDDAYWRVLRLDLLPGPAEESAGPPVVAVRNTALIRFVLSYFLGWALTPLVAVIRRRRGGLAGVERSPFLGAIVALQRRGRAQVLALSGGPTVAPAPAARSAAHPARPAVTTSAPAPSHYVNPFASGSWSPRGSTRRSTGSPTRCRPWSPSGRRHPLFLHGQRLAGRSLARRLPGR